MWYKVRAPKPERVYPYPFWVVHILGHTVLIQKLQACDHVSMYPASCSNVPRTRSGCGARKEMHSCVNKENKQWYAACRKYHNWTNTWSLPSWTGTTMRAPDPERIWCNNNRSSWIGLNTCCNADTTLCSYSYSCRCKCFSITVFVR